MSFLWDGLRQGADLLSDGDPYTLHLIAVTVEVALISTAVALLLGLPLGLLIGIGTVRRPARAAPGRLSRGARGTGLALGNAGLGLPPVLVGLLLSLLMFPRAPLGSLHLLFTLRGVIVAQTVLALPIVVALTAAAARGLPPGLLAQARALGAGTGAVWRLALAEARVGVIAAAIAAVGSAVSEVGAVVLVGGNVEGSTQTLASAALEQVNAGHFAAATAIGIVLLGLVLLVAAALTSLQLAGGR